MSTALKAVAAGLMVAGLAAGLIVTAEQDRVWQTNEQRLSQETTAALRDLKAAQGDPSQVKKDVARARATAVGGRWVAYLGTREQHRADALLLAVLIGGPISAFGLLLLTILVAGERRGRVRATPAEVEGRTEEPFTWG